MTLHLPKASYDIVPGVCAADLNHFQFMCSHGANLGDNTGSVLNGNQLFDVRFDDRCRDRLEELYCRGFR